MSGQIMMFPDSVEEFMESYKMVDTEHIYSNGTEYVPIFRMKQWFEHEVKHGEWEWVQYDANPQLGNFHCSECRFIPTSWNVKVEHLNYCPNCGAKMDGGNKMPKYINADILTARLKTLYEDERNQNVCTSWSNAYMNCEKLVEDLPAAVVECNHCIEWHPRESTNYGFCIRWGQYTKECDYCSYGK